MARILILALLLSAAACGVRSQARYQMVHLYGPPVVSADAYEHYLEGRIASLEGDHDLAIEHYRAAEEAAPDQPELPVAIAEEELAAGRPQQALVAAERAATRWKSYAPAHVTRGRALTYLGRGKEAAAAFERAIDLDRTGESAYLYAASAYGRLDDEREAERTYRRLVKEVPDSAEGHYRLGRIHAARREYGRAEKHFRQAFDADREHFEAAAALADVYRRTGRADEAAHVLRDLFDRSGEDPDVGRRLVLVLLESGERDQAIALVGTLTADWRAAGTRVELAHLYLLLGEPARALAVAEDVLARDPQHDGARLLAAAALTKQRQWARALAYSEAVPATSEYYLDAVVDRASTLGELNRRQEGIALLEKTLAEHPGQVAVIIALAGAYEQAGSPDRARTVLDDAIARAPEEDDLLYARASLEERIGDPERAVSIMKRLLDRDPDDVTALNFIGYSYANRGVKLDEAERMLRRAVELRPWDGYVLDSLGWCLFRRGKHGEATELLEQADRLAPGEPEILFHLGEAYLQDGQKQRALDLYVRALALFPEPDIRKQLEDRVHTLEARQ